LHTDIFDFVKVAEKGKAEARAAVERMTRKFQVRSRREGRKQGGTEGGTEKKFSDITNSDTFFFFAEEKEEDGREGGSEGGRMFDFPTPFTSFDVDMRTVLVLLLVLTLAVIFTLLLAIFLALTPHATPFSLSVNLILVREPLSYPCPIP